MTNPIGNNLPQHIAPLEESKTQAAQGSATQTFTTQTSTTQISATQAPKENRTVATSTKQQLAGKSQGASLRQMENVSASLVANQLKSANASLTASSTPSATTTISTGSVFKQILDIGRATSSDKGTKLTAMEAKAALYTFNMGAGTVKKSAVVAVQIEFNALKKSGKLLPEAEQVFSEWLKANANAPSGGQDALRRADAFREMESFVRYNADSQKGQQVTPAEVTGLLNILGPSPAPPRIMQVKQLRDELKASKQLTTTGLRSIDTWLAAHPLPAMPTTLSRALLSIVKGMYWPSETDRPIVPMILGSAPSPRANVANALRTALGEGKNIVVEETNFEDKFAQLSTGDPDDADDMARAAKFAQLRDALKGQLTDIHMFKVGTIDRDLIVVGRTADGKWAGIMSGVVET